jgi:hypothetical protein
MDSTKLTDEYMGKAPSEEDYSRLRAYHRLTEDERLWIDAHCLKAQDTIKEIGLRSAFDLIVKLGMFLHLRNLRIESVVDNGHKMKQPEKTRYYCQKCKEEIWSVTPVKFCPWHNHYIGQQNGHCQARRRDV